MTPDHRVTERNQTTTVEPDFPFEPGRTDHLYEQLVHWGLPTTAQGIMTLFDEVRRSRWDWTVNREIDHRGITVYVPGLNGDIAGTGRSMPEAYARAFVNMRRDHERQAVYLKAGMAALREYDADQGGTT